MSSVLRSAHPWFQALTQNPVVAVLRHPLPETVLQMGAVAIKAGIRHLEITTDTPAFGSVVQDLRRLYSDAWVGVGTVLTPALAEVALQSGGQFIVSPFLDLSILTMAQSAGVAVIPGALTPHEIWSAWQAGSTAVKVFPVASLGGSAYIRQLRGPLPHVPLIPTGGVTVDNGAALITAGATAIGLASDLFPSEWIRVGSWERIRERITSFHQQVLTAQSLRRDQP